MGYPNITSNRFASPFVFLLPKDSDISETEWLQVATTNPLFDFLKDPEEGIYAFSDGIPFHDAR